VSELTTIKIKTYQARSVKEALQQIRTEMGENAVILSNQSTSNGVSIRAANPEYLKQIEQQNISGIEIKPAKIDQEIQELKKMIYQIKQQNVKDAPLTVTVKKLMQNGWSPNLVQNFMKKKNDLSINDIDWFGKMIAYNLKVTAVENSIVSRGGTYALIGPTGVGKTTTLAKLAAKSVFNYGAQNVGLISMDYYRIGAFEQLKIYGQMLNIDTHSARTKEDLSGILKSMHNKKIVLIDTIGMSQRDSRVDEQMKILQENNVKSLLCIDAGTQIDALNQIANKYGKTVHSTILTKLDECITLGNVLDVVLRHQLRLEWITNGQRVPEDIHLINKNYLVHRAITQQQQNSK